MHYGGLTNTTGPGASLLGTEERGLLTPNSPHPSLQPFIPDSMAETPACYLLD